MHLSLQNELASKKFVWAITHFNRISQRTGFPFKSSIIHKKYARKGWIFFLYPSSNSDEDYVSVYFCKPCFVYDPILYNCLLSVGGSDGNPLKSFAFQSTDLQMFSIGQDKCIRKESIGKLLKGSVTVQCEISEISHKSFFPYMLADFENFSVDLTALYNFPMYSDLTICLQQFKFHLHSCVLYARCRRLSLLFGYHSFNEMPKIIHVTNISPYLFHQLMYYLYSGKLDGNNFSLELFRYADQLQLKSLKQCIYEKVQEHRTNTEIATQTLTITWNLKKIQFREEGGVPFVQMFQKKCCTTHLAVRMGISEHSDGERYIDVSFKVFLDTLYEPISLLCVMTLFVNGKVCGYKKDGYDIEEDDEWHFPPFVKLSDIPENNEGYPPTPDMFLTAEISLSDGCTAYNNVHTKTRLFTYSEPSNYPERLGSDMGRLRSSNVKNYDISLKSVDNCYIPAHKAMLWARWPAMRAIMKNSKEPYSYLVLNLRSEEIQMLLDYIYTGFIPRLSNTSADKLLQANAKMERPPYIVKKCNSLLYGRTSI